MKDKDNETNNLKHIYLICCIKNCVVLICFSILAIVFKNIWIVLFTALFWGSLNNEEDDE